MTDLREDNIHRVSSSLRISSCHLYHLKTISCELITKEHVSEVDLTNHIDKGQELTEKEVDGIATMSSEVFFKIFLDGQDSCCSFFRLRTE